MLCSELFFTYSRNNQNKAKRRKAKLGGLYKKQAYDSIRLRCVVSTNENTNKTRIRSSKNK